MSNTSNGGASGTSILQTLFIGLKLTGYIDWSWWWVMSPMWITVSFAFVVFLFVWFVQSKETEPRKRGYYY